MSNTNTWVTGIVLLVIGFFVGSYGLGIGSSAKNVAVASEMSASADGLALWQFPDKRALDPEIFGTPQNPLNSDLLPLSKRDVNTAGTAYTTIKQPAMFSNKTKQTTGSITISVSDLTAKDGPNSKDSADSKPLRLPLNAANDRIVFSLLGKGNSPISLS